MVGGGNWGRTFCVLKAKSRWEGIIRGGDMVDADVDSIFARGAGFGLGERV